ncbi:MAG: hypothetical protein LAT57_09145 [Balneolales bacterium]|nr:hypothetical protein [Balneolales bacterium]
MTKSYDKQNFKSYLKSGDESSEVHGKREGTFKFWLNYISSFVPSMQLDKTHDSQISSKKWQQLFTKNGFEVEAAGTDSLWDLPYSTKRSAYPQESSFGSHQQSFYSLIGFASWSQGENIVLILKKK